MKALIVIDMQAEMQRRVDAGNDHVNGTTAPAHVAQLVSTFRERGWPVLHVHHSDPAETSAFHPSALGHAPMPCAAARPGEPVFEKSTSSAFASTGLEAWLRDAGITDLVIVGAVAGFCVNSTVRAASDLGFSVTVARDAVIGFGTAEGPKAQTIFDVTMALLASDFAQVTDSDALLGPIKDTPRTES